MGYIIHLSVLSFILVPLGNILIPLVLWITNKDKIVNLDKQGIALLKFQIIWTLLFFSCALLYPFMFIQHFKYKIIPIYAIGLLIIINIAYTLVTTLQVKRKS